MKAFIVFATLLVAVAAQLEEKYDPIPYSFKYDALSEDGGKSSHEESGDGAGKVTGFYTLTNLEGHNRVVEYIADENGFRAVVKSNEPGTINHNSADVTVESSAEGSPVLNSAPLPAPRPAAPASPARRTGSRFVLVPATN